VGEANVNKIVAGDSDNDELFASETENEMEIIATLTPQDKKELHELHAFVAGGGTAEKHAKALKEHGEAGVAATLDGLTCLSQGEVPGWGNSDTEGDSKPAAASAAAPPATSAPKPKLQRCPREMTEDWSPCPKSTHQEETPSFRCEDHNPNQCLDLKHNVHSVAFNHPHDERCIPSERKPWNRKSTFASSSFASEMVETHTARHLDVLTTPKVEHERHVCFPTWDDVFGNWNDQRSKHHMSQCPRLAQP
jgi:hypothetical protein